MSARLRWSLQGPLLHRADDQLREFKLNRGVAPRLFEQRITVRREYLGRPYRPAWVIDLTAVWEDGPGNLQRAGWSVRHADLTEGLIRAGAVAAMFRTKLREKGHRRG